MSSSKKDMRRPELVVPYVEPEDKDGESGFSSSMTSSLPMAAMFTRNKLIGWAAVVFALQKWLAETPEQQNAGQHAILSVGTAVLSLVVCYAQLFLPPGGTLRNPGGGTGTEAPAAAPPA
ncbi:MAG: hypothetical protein M1832_000342 [Thelocarpon impressellum]|nr:MAG: hypothetical protein M1832_000342 [Thelocarpon impressellum]